jgi:hypothetical protein
VLITTGFFWRSNDTVCVTGKLLKNNALAETMIFISACSDDKLTDQEYLEELARL